MNPNVSQTPPEQPEPLAEEVAAADRIFNQPAAEPVPGVQQAPPQPVQPTGEPVQQVAQVPADPYLPPQPQVFDQAATPAPHDPGHGLGIAALIASLVAPLVGVILGIIALHKSKSAGHKNPLAVVGLVIGMVSTLLFGIVAVTSILANSQSVQAKARDTDTLDKIGRIHSKLEEFHEANASYPRVISSEVLGGIESASLSDINGNPIDIESGEIVKASEAAGIDLPTSGSRLQYIPFDCSETYCMGYVLRGYIEEPSGNYKNPYTKAGANNP